jgi:flagellar hook protein FlgE
MGTALFTGVTGLLAQQTRMDVVANNIANVSTTGYRSSRVDFQDLLSQTIDGGSPTTNVTGGTNPSQIGLGVTTGSISVDFTEGPLSTTGISSDLAIDGEGMFILSDGETNYYTRDGSFGLNSAGVFIDPSTGLKVQGYMADANGNVNTDTGISDITVLIGDTEIVQETQNGVVKGNLNSEEADGTTVQRTFRVYDSLGTARDVDVTFSKTTQVTVDGVSYNAWTWKAQYNGTDVTNVNSGDTGVVLFDSNGSYYAEGSIDGSGTFTPRASQASQNEVTIPDTLFTDGSMPNTPFDFSLDFSSVTSLADSSDISLDSQDGYERGVLEEYSVGTDGIITGSFTNGKTQVLGQIALAGFSNIGGLSRTGNNCFIETSSSGLAQIGIPDSGGRGQICGGELEGSNVDLGTEFSNMIVTQRAYQANARTITVSDTLLQETVNLVR